MKRRRVPLLLAMALGAAVAASYWLTRGASWELRSDEPVDAQAFSVRRLRFAKSNEVVEIHVVRMARNVTNAAIEDLRVGNSLVQVARDTACTLAINGGYFSANYEPIGLLRIAGKDAGALSPQPPLSGLVVIDTAGRIDVVPRTASALASAHSALQAGPFLIDPGGRLGIRFSDGKAAERTVIAIGQSHVYVLLTSPVTLFDLANLIARFPQLGANDIDRALNLDGGPSSGFVLAIPNKVIELPPRVRIQNAITFHVQSEPQSSRRREKTNDLDQ